MIAATVFQNFTPVQKDEYKIIHDYQFLVFFSIFFSIFIFYNPSVTISYFKVSSRLGSCFLCWANPPKSPAGHRLQHLPRVPLRQQRFLSAEKLTSQMWVFSLPTKYTSEHRTRDHTTTRISQQNVLAFFTSLVIFVFHVLSLWHVLAFHVYMYLFYFVRCTCIELLTYIFQYAERVILSHKWRHLYYLVIFFALLWACCLRNVC